MRNSGVVASARLTAIVRRRCEGRTWPFVGLALALAIGVAAAPADAQDIVWRRPFPAHALGRRPVRPIFIPPPAFIRPAFGAAAANAERRRAPPSSYWPPPSVRFPLHPASPPQAFSRAAPPPPGETRFRRGEVLVEASLATPPATLAAVARRHRLIETDAAAIALLGVSVHLWRIPDARDAAAVARELGGEAAATRVQPNYLYALQQTAAPVGPAGPSLQYALDKLRVDAALLATASGPVRVAVIDTAIDEIHPDLAGAIEARFDAIGDATPPRRLDHGTAVAGAIAARGRLKGVDPNVRILSARAFDGDGAGESGSTMALLKAIDWAAREQAKVVNMSFAGPPDPTLRDIVAAAVAKGLTLVAAAGNAGPQSSPLYPAADEGVIAVTATDAADRRYEKANVGRYIAVAAPGVDVLLPAPQGSYALETGTSVSAALVSGVAALLVALRPQAAPAQVRNWLVATATPLGRGRESEFGAGLVDARRAADAAIR
jgi:subtilisin family serine protease